MALDDTTLATLRAMPKTEVHVHLEGTVAPRTLWEMAQRNQVPLPAASLAELERLYVFEGFDKFLSLWIAMCRCFRTEDDYVAMVDAYVGECRRQNIRYAEVHFTPYNHERVGIGGALALTTVTRRLRELEAQGGPVIRLITDIPAEGLERAAQFTVALLEGLEDDFVVAIGLGGPEEGFPRAPFASYFARARDIGFACVAHAGETAGAEHVRQAVVDLQVRRIQHGIRAVEDDSVLELVAGRGICCDVTLTSNTSLTSYRDLRTHPLRRLLAAGVPVTLSTDDPAFFGTDLVREYLLAHEELGLSLGELWEINLTGLRHGLADGDLRRRLLRQLAVEGRRLGLGRDHDSPAAAREG